MHCFGSSNSREDIRAIWDEIDRLEDLQAALRVMLTPIFRPEQLVEKFCGDAPILDDWCLGLRWVPCLAGKSTGHPLLVGEGRQIATSEVYLFSPELSFARTYSRFYRLGRPAGDLSMDS